MRDLLAVMVGNVDEWWVISGLQKQRMASFCCFPHLRGNNEGVHRKGGWSLQQSSMISKKGKKMTIKYYFVCNVDLYLPFSPIYYIYNVSRNLKKHHQQLLNQHFILSHSIREAWNVGIWHFSVALQAKYSWLSLLLRLFLICASRNMCSGGLRGRFLSVLYRVTFELFHIEYSYSHLKELNNKPKNPFYKKQLGKI